MMPSETLVLSRTPALKTAAPPTAMAGLLGDRPARTPPAPPITARLTRLSWRRSPVVPDISQAIHAAPDRARVTAMAVPRGPGEPGPGSASETLTMTATRPKARTASIILATLTTRFPVTGSHRVASRNTPASPFLCRGVAINVTRRDVLGLAPGGLTPGGDRVDAGWVEAGFRASTRGQAAGRRGSNRLVPSVADISSNTSSRSSDNGRQRLDPQPRHPGRRPDERPRPAQGRPHAAAAAVHRRGRHRPVLHQGGGVLGQRPGPGDRRDRGRPGPRRPGRRADAGALRRAGRSYRLARGPAVRAGLGGRGGRAAVLRLRRRPRVRPPARELAGDHPHHRGRAHRQPHLPVHRHAAGPDRDARGQGQHGHRPGPPGRGRGRCRERGQRPLTVRRGPAASTGACPAGLLETRGALPCAGWLAFWGTSSGYGQALRTGG